MAFRNGWRGLNASSGNHAYSRHEVCDAVSRRQHNQLSLLEKAILFILNINPTGFRAKYENTRTTLLKVRKCKMPRRYIWIVTSYLWRQSMAKKCWSVLKFPSVRFTDDIRKIQGESTLYIYIEFTVLYFENIRLFYAILLTLYPL